ncbi:helix-turn-helix domain-containing protein [Candidatus Enterococcus mansonii]|uniref:Mga helix-turn-helix domain-containing protein n=1 Tax=Candidatus Enterococcus mansonii TaxID=1834181 RepID=A0A242CEV4_9ENTE|nr:helix-turn-helix domain-containing protein [Enterococcus sp. 4G2_DIV0659]OTO08450.1 hypothetical protein A5880_001450 [Enterococcus sp. 4G2_DIV0659]
MKEFITEQDNNKIQVLDFLINENKSVNMAEICSATQLSYKTVRSVIDSFEENTHIDKKNLEIYYNKVGKVESVKLSNSSHVDVSFFYLEKSILFIMIKELFLKGRIDNKYICETYYISMTTCARYKKKLRSLLESFGLEMTSSGELTSEEYRIRNFFIHVFSNASSNWIFSQEAYHFLEHSLESQFPTLVHMDSAQKELMRLLLYITIKRNSQGNILAKESELDIYTQGKLSKIYENVSTYVNKHFPYFENKESEILYLFVSMFRIQIIRANSKNEENELKVVIKDRPDFDEICDSLTESIITTFFQKDKEYFSFIRSNVTLFLVYATASFYDTRRFFYVYEEEIFVKRNTYEEQMYQKVFEIVERWENEHKGFSTVLEIQGEQNQTSFKRQVYLLVYSLLCRIKPVQHKEKVKIYVQNSKVYIADIIRRKIEKLFSDKITILDTYSSDVDIFVTDKEYKTMNESGNKVFVQTFSDSYAIHRLIEAVDNEILKKLDSEPFDD